MSKSNIIKLGWNLSTAIFCVQSNELMRLPSMTQVVGKMTKAMKTVPTVKKPHQYFFLVWNLNL